MDIVLEITLSLVCGVCNAAFYDSSETADIKVAQEQYLASLLKLSEDISTVRLTTDFRSNQYTESYAHSYETTRTKRSKRCQS